MTQARITRSSLWAAPRTLVYCDKIFCLWVRGVPLELGHQREVPCLKRRYFAAIGFYRAKTVAGKYRLAAYHSKHWWQAF